MGRKRTEKRKQRQGTDSLSGSSASDTSVLKPSEQPEAKSTVKKQKTATSAPTSRIDTLSQFVFKSRDEQNMEDKGENPRQQVLDESDAVFSPDRHDRNISNADLMLKLCKNGTEISKLSRMVEELQSAIFTIQKENDKLRQEMTEARQREELMKDQLTEARHLADLADRRTEDLAAYVRRNNIRIYGVKELESGHEETQKQCEDKVLSLFNDKLKMSVKREDIEVTHRVGQRRSADSSTDARSKRGIIVRFISRRVRDSVLYARKGLKGTSIVFVEDLTPRAYSLLCTVKSDTTVCQQAWTKNTNVVMKALNGKIIIIKSLAEFKQTDLRAFWSKQNSR